MATYATAYASPPAAARAVVGVPDGYGKNGGRVPEAAPPADNAAAVDAVLNGRLVHGGTTSWERPGGPAE